MPSVASHYWNAKPFGKFPQKLQETKDVDGQSLLHNPMILYGSGGGALTPGRYVQHGSKLMSNLFLSMAEKMGAQKVGNFGDSTGKLGDV